MNNFDPNNVKRISIADYPTMIDAEDYDKATQRIEELETALADAYECTRQLLNGNSNLNAGFDLTYVLGSDYDEMLQLLYRRIENTKRGASDEWIDVKDRLPKHSGQVLIAFDLNEHNRGFVTTARHEGGKWDWNSAIANRERRDSDVTHWMPLPEPPKEKT